MSSTASKGCGEVAVNCRDCTGPGATVPELLISAVCRRAFAPCDAHNWGRNTPAYTLRKKLLHILTSSKFQNC